MEFLRAHRCDELQGYYLSRPLSPAELLMRLPFLSMPTAGRTRSLTAAEAGDLEATGGTEAMRPIAVAEPRPAACKVCGGASPLYGVVDFHKSC